MSGRRFNSRGATIGGGRSRVGAGKSLLLPKALVVLKQELAYEAAKARTAAPDAEHPDIGWSKLVSKAAVLALMQLASAWSGVVDYGSLRSVTIEAFYRAFADARGMRVGTIEAILPALATDGEAAFLSAVRCLPYSDLTPEHYGAVHETLAGYRLVDGVIAPTDDRRKGGIHFTPRSLTEPIVRKTLEPLLEAVPPDKTLDLRVCDPAVGAGAFLLELVRQLGRRAFDAGLTKDLPEAKRLVAIHCAYGVDVDRFAIAAAKRAITLECHADQMPPSWLDDNVKLGDALVGLTEEQLRAFHWDPKKAPNTLAAAAGRAAIGRLLDRAMKLGVEARQLRMALLSEQARNA